MIKDVKANHQILHVCDHCGKERTLKISPKELKFLAEFNEIENYPLPACDCGAVEVLNMNLPDDEYDISDIIPDEEWRSRHIIKSIRRFVKGDVKDGFHAIAPVKNKKPKTPLEEQGKREKEEWQYKKKEQAIVIPKKEQKGK